MSRTPTADQDQTENIPMNKYTVLKDQYGTKDGKELKLAGPGDVVQGNDVQRPDGRFVQTVVKEVPIRIPWADVKPFETNVANNITQGLDEFFAPLAKNTVFAKIKSTVDGAISSIDPLYTIPTIMAGWGALGYAAHKGWKNSGTAFKLVLVGLGLVNTYITYRLARNVEKCRTGNQKVFNAIGEMKKVVGGDTNHEQMGYNARHISKPAIFTTTIYRIPTKAELEEVHKYNLSADDLIHGFTYTMVGKGMDTPDTIANIVASLAELQTMYPENETYFEALQQYGKGVMDKYGKTA